MSNNTERAFKESIPGYTKFDDLMKKPRILDSGDRTQFDTGAVRDLREGKGRCDLMPLDVVAAFYAGSEWADIGNVTCNVLCHINAFARTGQVDHLIKAVIDSKIFIDIETMLLETSIHFEEGAKKYGENNWQKGIPVRCYIDSAVRHYLKFLRGDKDEPHDRAFCWNIMCAIWTCKHKPELNGYRIDAANRACEHTIKACDEALARMSSPAVEAWVEHMAEKHPDLFAEDGCKPMEESV